MYIRRELITEDVMFRLDGGKYNTLVNAITHDKTNEDDYEINIAMVIRTDNTNEILINKNGSSIVFTNKVGFNDMIGYFSLATSCQELLLREIAPKFRDNIEDIKKTVLMPVGVFLHDNKVYFYFNLIIKPEIKDHFNYDFINIDMDALNCLDEKTIIVLPTISIVS